MDYLHFTGEDLRLRGGVGGFGGIKKIEGHTEGDEGSEVMLQ